MTTLTLQVDNLSILEHIKGLLSAVRGVKIVNTVESPVPTYSEDIPNDLTQAAMKEAEEGKYAGVVRMDSIEDFVASFD